MPAGVIQRTPARVVLSMRIVLLALLLAATSGTAAGELCRAVDGDTLRCGRERVRLLNIYAAELSEPGGVEARARLADLVLGLVYIDRRGRDQYGRTLAVLYVDGHRVRQADIGPRAGRGITVRARY